MQTEGRATALTIWENLGWRLSRVRNAIVPRNFGWSKLQLGGSTEWWVPKFIRTSTSFCGFVSLWLKPPRSKLKLTNRIGEAYLAGELLVTLLFVAITY